MPEGMASMVADLAAEQDVLLSLLGDIDDDDWLRPTPARGWDVRDTVSHLAHTDETAIDTMTGGPHPLNLESGRFATPDDYTLAGCLRGRRLSGREVRAWWERTSAREREVIDALEPGFRVPWGLGMSPPAFVTARLMETWAHSLDVHTALGVRLLDTDRLRHVAWIGYRALPYAYSVAGQDPPADPVRVELTGPHGDVWRLGPDDAPAVIRGPAGEFCRLFVQRLDRADATGLIADGAAADAALAVARAYL
jgi:uncharacterized protein (TIGR03084 family)